MDLALDDKVVFVTGASGGIGRAMARAFAQEGARVALHGHRKWDDLVEWVAKQDWNERALPVEADITSASSVAAAFERAREHWGRIDVCVANAGIWPPDDEPLVDLDEDRIRTVFEVNLFGAIWTAKAFLSTLRATGPRPDGHGAALLFTGSTAASFGERGHTDYAASKAGLVGLMRSLKNEIVALDPYARVNIVEPGWTVTEMTRRTVQQPEAAERVVRTMALRQLGRADDVARAAVMLASPAAARHVSGQVLTVAGGMEGRVLWEDGETDGQHVLDRLKQE
ncbi:MAG: SDR family oxidoreductase [bacterium]|nr:SDR family oxidoreductase [bacterium]